MENIHLKIIGVLAIGLIATLFTWNKSRNDLALSKLEKKTVKLETEAVILEKKREEIINGIEKTRRPIATKLEDKEIIRFWSERVK